MSDVISDRLEPHRLTQLVADLNRYLRLRTTPIGMKLFATVAEMEAIPRIRRPQHVHATDQIVGQASRNGWTVGITADDLVGDQCRAVVGLSPRDEQWLSGERMAGVWYENAAEASKHQQAMDLAPFGNHVALAASPLASGRLNPPDIALIYATPAQMILFINGLQWTGFKKLEWGLRWRIGLRRLVGTRLGDRRTQPLHSLFRRTALRRRDGGRTAYGDSAGLSAER